MKAPRSVGKEISYLSRSLMRDIDAKVAHLGLSSASIPFLTYLYDNEGVHQDIQAEALRFDKSSAARTVAKLEREGYISKRPDQSNRRERSNDQNCHAFPVSAHGHVRCGSRPGAGRHHRLFPGGA